jgi:hypothetical protein
MYSLPADLSLYLRIRALLYRSGRVDISRLNDREVEQTAHSLLASGVYLRNIEDIEAAIAFFAQFAGANRQALLTLLERAAELLDFGTDRDRGVIYAAQYATYRDPLGAVDKRLAKQIRDGAEQKGAIGSTPGGRWLLRRDLHFLIGGAFEDAVWARASERFIEALTGQVTVLPDYPQFDRALRTLAPHPLFNVPEITGILYRLDRDGARILNADPALFADGVIKQVHGRVLLTFRAARK